MIELLPEPEVDMADCVYSQGVKAILSDNIISDPIEKDFFDFFTLCIKIWKAEKSAFFDSLTIVFLVVFVFNVARLVIMLRLIEWNDV